MATYTDDFTGADGTALATHDANWTSSGVTLLSNEAKYTSGGQQALYQQAVGADAFMQFTVGTANNGSNTMYMVFRRTTSDGATVGVRVGFRESGLTIIYDGSSNVWSDTTTWPEGTVCRAEISSNNVSIYKNGSLVHTYNGVVATHNASKYNGLYFSAGNVVDAWSTGDLVPANQTASPTSDITVGSWSPSTGATLFGVIDEVTPADADYIYTTSAGAACEVKLAAVSQPDTGTCTLSYRLYSTSADNIQVDLVENTTVRQTWNHNPAPTTVTQYDQTITTPANITDWANLRVRFTATAAA